MKRYLFFLVFNAFVSITKSQTVNDADGNVYSTVTIGTQTWMAENLKTTSYKDGSAIPLITDSLAWLSDILGAYTWYRNDITYKAKYGAVYNWYAVNNGKLCPVDWHVPSIDEWTTLENYLIANGFNYDGTSNGDRATNNKIAKALADTTSWNPSSDMGSPGNTDFQDKRNATGFKASAGGFKDFYGSFGFFTSDTQWHPYFGIDGAWWSSSEIVTGATTAWWIEINTSAANVVRSHNEKYYGLSVRCVKDSASSSTGIKYQTSREEAGFYPNPATEKLYFKNIRSGKSAIVIFDLEGKQVLNNKMNADAIDISKLSKGIYIVKRTTNGNTTTSKLVKE